MKKYTVILLYPDYLASDEYGKETYTAWIELPHTPIITKDLDAAVKIAQRQALNAQSYKKGIKIEDFHPLFIFEGHLDSLI